MEIPSWLERTLLLVGKEKMEKIMNARVLVCGLGGVGSYSAEMLVRSGVMNLTIVDFDTVALSNINRQLPALHSTVGLKKCDVVAARLRDINPEINLTVIDRFLKDDEIPLLINRGFDYVIDAIDTLSPKVFLSLYALKSGACVVSSGGAGGKFDISRIRVDDISKTYGDALARAYRKRLKHAGISSGIKMIFSDEQVDKSALIEVDEDFKKNTPGSLCFVTSAFGNFAASTVINMIINN